MSGRRLTIEVVGAIIRCVAGSVGLMLPGGTVKSIVIVRSFIASQEREYANWH